MKRLKRTMVVIGCLMLLQSVSWAATYYLDAVNGNDSYPGTSSEPWQTLVKAQSVAAEGDTVLLYSGNYGAFVDETTVRTGWVTYQADAGHTPIFSSINLGRWDGPFDKYLYFKDITVQASAPERSAIWALRTNHLVFENMEIIGQGYKYFYWPSESSDSKAIFVQDSLDIIIKDCHIYGIGDSYAVNWPNATSISGLDPSLFGKAFVYGIQTLRVPNIEVSGCVIESCDVGMSLGDARNSVIRGNNLSYFSSDGIELTGGVINQNGQWTIIENNHISYLGHFTTAEGRVLSAHNDAIQFFGTYGVTWLNYKNIVVRGNIVHDSDQQGFFFRVGGDSENWIIENNLVYNIPAPNSTSLASAVRIFSTDNITFRNNTVDAKVIFESEQGTCRVASIENNIIWLLDLYTELGVIVDHEDYNIIRHKWVHMDNHVLGNNSVVLGTGEEFENLFTDYAARDFHLASDSLPIDFCALDNAPAIDLEGNARVDIQGVGNDGTDYADAGCYEYGSSPSSNQAPTADAGANQTVTDSDENGSESVTLDGSGSTDPDGTITSYVWTENESQIATGISPTVTLSIGVHMIMLTVTDDGGMTDTDAVIISVVAAGNQAPTADAGADQTIIDSDGNGSEQVTLDGSGSKDPDGTIVSFVWSKDGLQIATGIKPTVIISTGTHLITLTVTDDGGLTDTDTVTIKVLEGDKEFGELSAGCYNNVFNPAKGERALIVVELPKQAHIRLNLYNTRGNRIRELANEEKEAGTHKYYWDGRNDSGNIVGSGLYFVHIQAGDYKKTKKIVVVK